MPKPAFFLLFPWVGWTFLLNLAFKWKHQDGSIVEFSVRGRRADGPGKADWLTKMNQFNSFRPAIAPVIRPPILFSTSNPFAYRFYFHFLKIGEYDCKGE